MYYSVFLGISVSLFVGKFCSKCSTAAENAGTTAGGGCRFSFSLFLFFFLSRGEEIVLYIFNGMVFRLNNYKTAL